MCFINDSETDILEDFNHFKANLEFWGIHELENIKRSYIEFMFRGDKPLYIITESGKIQKIKKGKLIKQIIEANIKFKFINKETYYSLYALDKDSKKLYYELMEV